jgi:hypothetical protein
LDLLCEIAKYKEENIEIIISKILEQLCQNKGLLSTKGLDILSKLCSVLAVDRVYLTISGVLLKMKVIRRLKSELGIHWKDDQYFRHIPSN